MKKYDLHETSFSIPADTIIEKSKYITTAFKQGPLDFAYHIEPIVLRCITMEKECSQPMTWHDVIDCYKSLITEKFVTMYYCVYAAMLDARVANSLDES